MTLFDDSNPPYFDSSTTTLTEQPNSEPHSEPRDDSASAQQEEQRPAGAEDFASALESFTTETEESVGEDHVIRGTVLKITPSNVFVDIGAKSEGILPIAEVLDQEYKQLTRS
jgi:transcriptional accessory protein Tex/SPT6